MIAAARSTAAGEEAEDEAGTSDDLGPADALASDMTDASEAEALLHEAREHSPFLEQLTAGDIASLAEVITVVGFETDEQVLAKGEPATWVGIVLSGELAAVIDGQVCEAPSAWSLALSLTPRSP